MVEFFHHFARVENILAESASACSGGRSVPPLGYAVELVQENLERHHRYEPFHASAVPLVDCLHDDIPDARQLPTTKLLPTVLMVGRHWLMP